jgi:cysteine synthase
MRSMESLKIGGNPIVKIGEQIGFKDADVHAVLEYKNPGGSHKDRPVKRMIEKGIETGEIQEDTRIIEYTTGSAGISVARICREIGLKATLVMPEDITEEREKLIIEAKAELILSPRIEFVRGAIQKALEIREATPNSHLLNQSGNPENKNAFHDLGREILAHFQDGRPIDFVVIGAGTGATAVGVGEILKAHSPHTKLISIDESGYPTTLLFKQGVKKDFGESDHTLYGFSAGAVPPIIEHGIQFIDEIQPVQAPQAYEVSRELMKKGIYVGPTSAANIIVTRQILRKFPKARIVTVFFDKANRYRSVGLY